jgi:hypothetical protein
MKDFIAEANAHPAPYEFFVELANITVQDELYVARIRSIISEEGMSEEP